MIAPPLSRGRRTRRPRREEERLRRNATERSWLSSVHDNISRRQRPSSGSQLPPQLRHLTLLRQPQSISFRSRFPAQCHQVSLHRLSRRISQSRRGEVHDPSQAASRSFDARGDTASREKKVMGSRMRRRRPRRRKMLCLTGSLPSSPAKERNYLWF